MSILAVYAMRPQLAMAALLLLMIGSSLFFLRARPGARDSVLVTERGVPETRSRARRDRPAPAPLEAPAPAGVGDAQARERQERSASRSANATARKPSERRRWRLAAPRTAEPRAQLRSAEPLPGTEPTADSLEAASAAFQGGRYVEAQRRFEEIAARGGSEAPRGAALQAVEALRRQRGCPAAAPRYEEVHSRYRDTPSGNEAAWQAGRLLPRARRAARSARQSLEALLEVAEYRSRAEAALQELTAREEQVAAARKAKAAARRRRRRPRLPARRAAAPASQAGQARRNSRRAAARDGSGPEGRRVRGSGRTRTSVEVRRTASRACCAPDARRTLAAPASAAYRATPEPRLLGALCSVAL